MPCARPLQESKRKEWTGGTQRRPKGGPDDPMAAAVRKEDMRTFVRVLA